MTVLNSTMANLASASITALLLAAFAHAFPQLRYTSTLREESEPPELIANIAVASSLRAHIAVDRTYRFKLGKDTPYFFLDERTSSLRTQQKVDLEDLCRSRKEDCDVIKLSVNVWDSRDNLKATILVEIRILDVNDHSPIFEDGPVWRKKVREVLVRKGQKIELPVAYDNDWNSRFNKVGYSIDANSNSVHNTFELKTFDDGRPYLLLTRVLDRERQANYTFKLIARDDYGRNSSIKVIIIVLDVDDNPPKFTSSIVPIEVPENTKVGTILVQLNATDPDEGRLTYEMGSKGRADAKLNSIFKVRSDGAIVLNDKLDYELQKSYRIPVRVRDSVQAAQSTVQVKVTDVNDCPPEYIVNPAVLTVMEESNSREPIGEIRVFDRDEDGKAPFMCTTSNTQGLQFREKDPSKPNENYHIIPLHSFDREKQKYVTGTLRCYDKSAPKTLSSLVDIKVRVLDLNDNSPRFRNTTYVARIEEEQPKNTLVYQFQATDPDEDENGRVTYQLGQTVDNSENGFYIDSRTGRLTTNRRFDREERNEYMLMVMAKDHGERPRTATVRLKVIILDINDNPPKLTGATHFEVKENLPINTFVGKLSAEDPDLGHNGTVRFSIAPPQTQARGTIGNDFKLHPNGSIFTRRRFDRERRSEYCLSVSMQDGSPVKPQVRMLTVCIRIKDENDNKPIFVKPENESIIHRISIDDTPGQGILLVRAEDSDSGRNGMVEYQLKNNDKRLFSIDPSTGEVKLRKMLTSDDKGDYKLGVMAADRGEPPMKTFLILNIRVEDGPRRLFGTFDWHDNRNVLIVVILSTVSAFLAIVLISAIICMVRPCGRSRRSPNILYKPAADDTWSPHSQDSRILQMPRVSNATMSGAQTNAAMGMCVDSNRMDCRSRLGSTGGSATMPRKSRNPSNSLTRIKLEDGDPAVRIWPYDPERRPGGRLPGEHERDHSDSGRGGSEDDLSSRVAAAGFGPAVSGSGPVLQTFQTLDRHHPLPQSPLHPGGPPHAGVRPIPTSTGTLPAALKNAPLGTQVVHIPMTSTASSRDAAFTQLSTLNRRGAGAEQMADVQQNNLSTSGGYERLQHRVPPTSRAEPPVKETAILDGASQQDGSASNKVDAHKLVEEIDNLFFKDMMV